MSAPAPATAEAPAAPKVGSKKKLLIIALTLLLLLGAGAGGGALWWTKKKADRAAAQAAAGDEAENGSEGSAEPAHRSGAPVFVVLDPFTVNLADRDAERYAQVGITLEVEDAKAGEQIKQFMPAVRNNILLALADKTAGDLHAREGKRQLADEVLRETARALGAELPPATAAARRKVEAEATGPVRAVHFSNFIIQ